METTMSRLIEVLDEIATCCVCRNISPEPFCCDNAHTVCFSCLSRMGQINSSETLTCPICRSGRGFSEQKNIIKLLSAKEPPLKFDCPNAGCCFKNLRIGEHLSACQLRPFFCIHCKYIANKNIYIDHTNIHHHYAKAHPGRAIELKMPIEDEFDSSISTDITSLLRNEQRCLRDRRFGNVAFLGMYADLEHKKDTHSVFIGGISITVGCASDISLYAHKFSTFKSVDLVFTVMFGQQTWGQFYTKPSDTQPQNNLQNRVVLPSIFSDPASGITVLVRSADPRYKLFPIDKNDSELIDADEGDKVVIWSPSDETIDSKHFREGIVTSTEDDFVSINLPSNQNVRVRSHFKNAFIIE